MASLPDPPATLADAVAGLRLVADRDIPEVLIAHQDDPALARALGQARAPSGAELGRRVEESGAHRMAGRGLWLTVTDAGADECRGQVDVIASDAGHCRADLRLWIAPRDRGRGLGTAALALAGRWLLGEVGLARVQMFAPPANAALASAAARAGFRREGVLRGYWLGSSGRVDAEVHALIAADLT
jgi:RimJ/RimL family protein N-acetyltransferase